MARNSAHSVILAARSLAFGNPWHVSLLLCAGLQALEWLYGPVAASLEPIPLLRLARGMDAQVPPTVLC
jgi:hypothetical protein